MRILRVFASAILAFCCASANASLVLTIDDLDTPGVDVVIVDGEGIGEVSDGGSTTTHVDGNAGAGLVSFTGMVDDWFVTMSLGSSKPAVGPPGQLDLEFSAFTTGAPTFGGSLVVMLTDTDFNDAFGAPFYSLSGTTMGTVEEIDAGADEDNEEFSINNPVDTARVFSNPGGTFVPFAFTGGGSGEFFEAEDPFSLSQTIKITHSAIGQVTTFNASVFVPEPATLALFGLGLVGLGFSRRRRV